MILNRIQEDLTHNRRWREFREVVEALAKLFQNVLTEENVGQMSSHACTGSEYGSFYLGTINNTEGTAPTIGWFVCYGGIPGAPFTTVRLTASNREEIEVSFEPGRKTPWQVRSRSSNRQTSCRGSEKIVANAVTREHFFVQVNDLLEKHLENYAEYLATR